MELLEGAEIGDNPITVAEYHKALRDVAKQVRADEGSKAFDKGGEAAERRMDQKLDILNEDDEFARTFPGSGGHDAS